MERNIVKFKESALNNVYKKREAEVLEYKTKLDKELEDYRSGKIKQNEAVLLLEEDMIQKTINEGYTDKLYLLKKKLSQRTDEMKDIIFKELLEKLEDFKKTEEYLLYLAKLIETIKSYCKPGDSIQILIDPTDGHLKEELEKRVKCPLVIEDSFIGGVRAFLNDNVMIDNSFQSKFGELQANFSLLKYGDEIAG
jgi:vacuolar-type H+-ATPase subunit E/Vma4